MSSIANNTGVNLIKLERTLAAYKLTTQYMIALANSHSRTEQARLAKVTCERARQYDEWLRWVSVFDLCGWRCEVESALDELDELYGCGLSVRGAVLQLLNGGGRRG